MTPQEKMQKLKNDFQYFAKTLLRIRTKDNRLIPFELNSMQKKIDAIIEDLRRQGKPVRLIILKARQMGCSTYTEGRIFHATIMNKLMHSLIVAHEEKPAGKIFEMSKLFYEELPEGLKPMRKAVNARELVFENPTSDTRAKKANPGLRSRITIETAKNKNIGRADTIHNLHASELAFWPDAATTMGAIMQMIPNMPNTIVIWESTANGIGDFFYDAWMKAKNGESDFVPLFFPWFEHEAYRMPVPIGFELTEKEKELKEQYGLDDEQIVWRRWCIQTNCQGNEDLFNQEYPSNDIECFLVTGTPVFPAKAIANRILELKNQDYKVGDITYKVNDEGDPIKGTERFVENPHGFLKIYRMPEKGRPYVIGGDTAEGGMDYCVGQVIDNVTGEQVAVWRAHTDTDLYAKAMFALGLFYNNALISIETNFDLHPVKELQRLRYPKQYHREVIDSISKQRQRKYGFRTTNATRGPMIGNLVQVVRDEIHLINDIDTLNEMLVFVRNEDGRPEAQEGKHDDLVMALAIAHASRDQQTMRVKGTPKLVFADNVPESERPLIEKNLVFLEKYAKFKQNRR